MTMDGVLNNIMSEMDEMGKMGDADSYGEANKRRMLNKWTNTSSIEEVQDNPEERRELIRKYSTGDYVCYYKNTHMSKYKKIDSCSFTAPLYKYRLVLIEDSVLVQAIEFLRDNDITTSCGIKNTTRKELYRTTQSFLKDYRELDQYSFAGDQKYIAKYFKFTGPKLTFSNGRSKTLKDNYVGK